MELSEDLIEHIRTYTDTISDGYCASGAIVEDTNKPISIVQPDELPDVGIIPRYILNNENLLNIFQNNFTIFEIPCIIQVEQSTEDKDDDYWLEDPDEDVDDWSEDNERYRLSNTCLYAVVNNNTQWIGNPFGYALYGMTDLESNTYIKEISVDGENSWHVSDLQTDAIEYLKNRKSSDILINSLYLFNKDIQNIILVQLQKEAPQEYEVFLKSISEDMFTE